MEPEDSVPFSQESATGPSQHISLRCIVILYSYLCLFLPSAPLPSGFVTKIFYEFLVCLMHATCPTHFILLDLITQKICAQQKSQLRNALYVVWLVLHLNVSLIIK